MQVVGTFCLVSVQTGIALRMTDRDDACALVLYALGVGFVVTALIEAFAPMGGAHMNPALTVGFALAGEVTASRRKCNYLDLNF